jgi:hypothetical protein
MKPSLYPHVVADGGNAQAAAGPGHALKSRDSRRAGEQEPIPYKAKGLEEFISNNARDWEWTRIAMRSNFPQHQVVMKTIYLHPSRTHGLPLELTEVKREFTSSLAEFSPALLVAYFNNLE